MGDRTNLKEGKQNHSHQNLISLGFPLVLDGSIGKAQCTAVSKPRSVARCLGLPWQSQDAQSNDDFGERASHGGSVNYKLRKVEIEPAKGTLHGDVVVEEARCCNVLEQ